MSEDILSCHSRGWWYHFTVDRAQRCCSTPCNVQDNPKQQRMIWPRVSRVSIKVEKLEKTELAAQKRLGPGKRAASIQPNSHHRTPEKFRNWRHPAPLKAKGRVPIKIRVFNPKTLLSRLTQLVN